MNSKNTDDTPSASRTTLEDRSWRWQILSGIPRRNRGLTTTISGKWQSRIRGRRKSRYGGRFSCILSATFVSLLRIVIVKTVTVATPPPPRGRHYGRVTRDFITVTQPRQPAIAHCISRVMQMQARVTRLYTARRDPY